MTNYQFTPAGSYTWKLLASYLVAISQNKKNRFELAIEKLNERYHSFGNTKPIDKNLVRKDLEAIKKLYNIEHVNNTLKGELKNLINDKDQFTELNKWYLKITGKTSDGKSYFVGVKRQLNDVWFERVAGERNVFLNLGNEHYQNLLEEGFEYKTDARLDYSTGVSKNDVRWHNYKLIKLKNIEVIGGVNFEKRKENFKKMKELAIALNAKNWIKELSKKEKEEQEREKRSIQNRLKIHEDEHKKAEQVYEFLEPKLKKIKVILDQFKRLNIKPSPTFPNSMTFVQNPHYQAIHSGYKALRELTNLSDDDLLLSLEQVDEIGLINMPLLYERWCLLQIIKVLVQNYHYSPSHDWKRKLLKIALTNNRNESLDFTNNNVGRHIKLWYESKLSNGKTPDFVMDVTCNKKDKRKDLKQRFVMDAKFYSDDVLQRRGGISAVIRELYESKDYSEGGKNAVFILHPSQNAIDEKISPQIWGDNSYFGELKMFNWDLGLRKKNYHKYGAICANPVLRIRYLDEFQRLIGMFLQYGVENNQLDRSQSDDVESINFCIACGSHDLKSVRVTTGNMKASWYECNDCKHFTTYNHCHHCNTRLIKNGDYWSYHSQMPIEPLNIKCPACESLL